MRVRPSDQEIQKRIADLLKTPRAGRAVAGHLREQADDWAHRAALCDLRARRLEALRGGVPDDAIAAAPPGSRVH
jgi:hypothetical protein